MAKTKTVEDLFHDTLKDIYYAEKKIVKALRKMRRAATNEDLQSAFETHEAETEQQISRLQEVFDAIDKPARGKTCEAIEGLISEAEEIIGDYKGSPALDAGLLASAQAVEHYEIARYGTLRSWAEMMNRSDVASLLSETLEEEKRTDSLLTEVASELNADAREAEKA